MDELKRLVELISEALDDLEKLGGAEATFRTADAPDIERLRLAVNAFLEQLDQISGSLRGELTESAEIAKRLVDQGPGGRAGGAVTATDLAKGFRSVIETMQREAGEGASARWARSSRAWTSGSRASWWSRTSSQRSCRPRPARPSTRTRCPRSGCPSRPCPSSGRSNPRPGPGDRRVTDHISGADLAQLREAMAGLMGRNAELEQGSRSSARNVTSSAWRRSPARSSAPRTLRRPRWPTPALPTRGRGSRT